MEKKEQYLGTEPIGKLLFQLAIPAVFAQLINLLYSIVDRIYIGRIPGVGATALTGIGITSPVLMLISAFAALVGLGGAPRASILLGKNQKVSAEETLGNCVTLILLFSVTLTILFYCYAEEMLWLFGASNETLPYALAYVQVYTMGTIFVQIVLGLNPFITAQGFTKVSMITVMVGAIINIILDPIFIFVLDFGVKGAALATIIAQCVSAVWVLLFLTGKKTLIRIQKKNLPLKSTVILSILGLGVSPFIMQTTESLLSIAFNTSLLKYGDDLAVGAMTIIVSAMQVASLPLSGITQGMQPILGFNYGAGHIHRMKHIVRLTAIVVTTITTLYWTLNMVYPEFFVKLFTDDLELIEYTAWAIRIYMGVYCIYSGQIVCQQSLIALGNVKTSLFLAVLRKIILLIPSIYILPLFFEDKVFAVFLAEPVSDFIAVCTTVTLFTIQFRKTIQKMEREQKEKELMGN
ncbi:MAG: MATE family efflux transporter [Eubacteriales bacterium]